MKHLNSLITASVILVSSLIYCNIASASTADFIDHGNYTTDTISGLDWLDVTLSLKRTFNDVSSQFGVGGDFEGWRYASGIEFNQMVKNFTGTSFTTTDYSLITQPFDRVDDLVSMLGSTIDSWWLLDYGKTYDENLGVNEGQGLDYTMGLIGDPFQDGEYVDYWVALILDDEQPLGSGDSSRAHDSHMTPFEYRNAAGSYLVRDNLITTPIPASFWLMGTGLFGFMGYSHIRKTRSFVA